MEDATKIWLDDADYDIKSAAAMLKAGRYFYVVFMCHLAIEKMLKALWFEETREYPPKSHNLLYLLKEAKLQLPDDYLRLITDLNDKNVMSRYPDGRRELAGELNSESAKQMLSATRGFFKWLKQNGTLKK
ncbi:MAG TPA: HEPN domain-containing protein [Nitrospirota bacterium]